MVDKPGRRKKGGHRKAYLGLTAVVLTLLAGAGYLAISGQIPFLKGSTTCSTASVTVTEVRLNSSSPVYANISTSMGTFEVKLFTAQAPKTVANFVSLSESGFYDNLLWWRVEPGFVIQTGDPTTRCGAGQRTEWGTGPSPTSVPFENNSLRNYEGYLGMASTGPGVGGGSQFYINLSNSTSNLSLDGKYAVFGKVVKGLGVVLSIGSVPVEAIGNVHEPVSPVYVYSVTILPGP